jgi:WD40 repeat protein
MLRKDRDRMTTQSSPVATDPLGFLRRWISRTSQSATNPPADGYDAFATYATDPDRSLVRNVENFIESVHWDSLLPEEFREPLSLCVDGHDFAIPKIGPGSSQTLVQHMSTVVRSYQAASRCLIVFSGSETTTHKWINDEITWWRQQANHGPIYFALTHGQIKLNAHGDVIYEHLLPNVLINDPTGLSPVWFDLREYHRTSFLLRPPRSDFERSMRQLSRAWLKVRDFEEERLRLVTQLISDRHGQPLSLDRLFPQALSNLRRRRRIRRATAAGTVVALLSGAAYADRVLEGQGIESAISATQSAVDDERYEDAIKHALTALPADGDFFWRHGWSEPNTRRLLATLAGAAQRSAFDAQLEPNEHASIQSVAFDPTGTMIVAASQSGKVSIWDSAARRKTMTCIQNEAFPDAQINRAENSTDWVRDSRFGETHERVLSAGTHGAWIWSPTCKQCNPDDSITCLPLVRMREVDHTKDFRTATFSPDWKTVLTTSDDGTVKEWNAHDGTLRSSLELPPSALPPAYSYTTDAAYSRDGTSVATSRRDGLLAIVNAYTRETKILQRSGPAVRSVQFDKSGKKVLSTSANGEVAIWDISSGTRAPLPKQNAGVGKASFSPDERFVLTTSIDGVARLWDVSSLTQVYAFKGHARAVLSAVFRPPDGKQIATSSDDQTIRLWNIGTNIVPSTLRVSSFPIESSAMSDGDHELVVGTFDGRILILEIQKDGTLHIVKEFDPKSGAITSVSPTANVGTVAFATDRGSVGLWDYRKDVRLPLPSLPEGRSFVAICPKGRLVTTGSARGIEGVTLTDIQTGVSLSLEEARAVYDLRFNAVGTQVAAASDIVLGGKRLALIWNTKDGKIVHRLPHNNAAQILSVHFSQDGSRLATASLELVFIARVWDVASGGLVQEFRGHTFDVKSARLSSEGERLVTASSDRTVRVWDVATAQTMLRLQIGEEPRDAFFARNGRDVIVATASGEILTYDVSWTAKLGKELVARVCQEKLPQRSIPCFRNGPLSLRYWREKG